MLCRPMGALQKHNFCALNPCIDRRVKKKSISWKRMLPQKRYTFRPRYEYHPHYGDVINGVIASQITSLTIVYSSVYSDADQTKHLSSASLAFVRVIHRGPVNSPHKWPVTRKMFPSDDVIMKRLASNFSRFEGSTWRSLSKSNWLQPLLQLLSTQ